MKFSVKSREATAVPAPTPMPGRARTMEEVATASTSELSIKSVRWRYSLNFFGDMSLSVGNSLAENHFLGFAMGAQDILIKGELGNHIIATTETAVEPHDGGAGLDLERYNVRWQIPSFYVEIGRSHTALGYWNNAYHHGRWLQLTIERPRWVAFEDDNGVLPVHWVGLTAGGKINLGTAHLDVVASMGNGRGRITDDVRTNHDFQSMKAFYASAELVGLFSSDLRVGIVGIVDRIPSPEQTMVEGADPLNRMLLPGPNQPINEMIGGVHIAYPSVPLIFIAEAYTIVHSANVMGVGQHSWATFGGFGLLGYAFGRFTPYIEVERFATQGGQDPFFIPDPAAVAPEGAFNTAKGILGLRIDLSDWTAIKAEYRATRLVDSGQTVQLGIVNWSWGF